MPLNDFDRMEKFADDEVFEDEVIFKLINITGEKMKRKKQKRMKKALNLGGDNDSGSEEDAVDIEEYQDDKPQHIIDGYDCFSIYKHQDISYEWRLCKIIKTEIRPEFKHVGQQAMSVFQEMGNKKKGEK